MKDGKISSHQDSPVATAGSPGAYPAWEESDVVLRSGSTLRLRPIRPDDAPKLLAFERGLPAGSPYFAFLGIRGPDPAAAQASCRVDYRDRFTYVGEGAGRILAVGHYRRGSDDPERAEVTFAVDDAFQGQGIGTRLLERLAEIARERDIATFEARILGPNPRMLDVFRNCGFPMSYRVDAERSWIVVALRPTADFEEKSAERSEKAAAASMARLFEPRSVAVIGASRERGKIGAEILHNLVSAGFRGRIFPINPGAASIEGVPCFPRLTEVPEEVDLAVVVVPAAAVPAAIEDCIAHRVKAVIVITAGFSETGAEGRAREAALLDRVREAGIRMVGPNCMGIVNTDPAVRLNATFAPIYPPDGRVALSSQSGALGLALLDYASQLNLGISTFVSVGNKTDVSSNDLVQYWAEDPRTDVILLYLESFGSPGVFGRIARRVARRKPIIAVKSGRSRAGARAASSHTGALAESDTVVDALFRQAGVIRTGTLEELFDVATLLAHQPVPSGRRVAIVTNAGGPGILAADACEAQGLELPPLAPATAQALRCFLPAAASVKNPVDMLASAPPEHYARTLRAVLDDPGIDSVLAIFIPPIAVGTDAVAEAVVAGTRDAASKPVLAIFMSTKGAPEILRPIPTYPFPESAAIALARATRYGEWLSRPAGTVPEFPDCDVERARRAVAPALERGGGWLDPIEARDLLSAFGIPAAPLRVAASAEEAVRAAGEVGLPVALKAVGPSILHKTEVGGVRLGLETPEDVREAAADLASRLGGEMTGILVQAMIPGGVETIVGVVRDPTFGPLVLYGSGGTLVELVSDVSFRLHPLTDVDAREMLEEVKGTALLRGYRGAPRADEAALRELLLRVSALVEACPEVREMDLNPVKVLAQGTSVVDARIRVERRPVPPRSRRIVY
jgi:acetyl coenzyme A synthetase (ADP forming)-like protein